MLQKHRIYTDIGKDQNITVELKQDYDLLEILSLKFTQKDTYTSLCSDYGVVCGRIIVNNGFGVPNARVSIFVPLSDEDSTDPVISALYPYKDPSERNEETNYRYNLLPARKQHGGHEPTGTFPDQLEVLNREEVLEVYEKYYKYTVKTNESGDFMIWGVPLGLQKLHVDLDLSDMGCFSLRPDDFIRQGVGLDQFKTSYAFKASEDIDSLPQIVSFDKTVEVVPFWGNVDLCQIGITRTDFDLSDKGVKIEPKAILLGSIFSDQGNSAVNKNCAPRGGMGNKCNLITEPATVEILRFTNKKDSNGRPILELMETSEDVDDSGSFMVSLPMNMEYVYTNEFGENEITNDPNKGIATSACYRFRVSTKNESLGRVRTIGSYLIPNIREYATSGTEIDKSYTWSTNWNDYPSGALNDNILFNNVNGSYYPQDYFYRFNYNKIYSVSSFFGSYSEGDLGITQIAPKEEDDCQNNSLTPPINHAVQTITFAILISIIINTFERLIYYAFIAAVQVLIVPFQALYNWHIYIRALGVTMIDYRPFRAGGIIDVDAKVIEPLQRFGTVRLGIAIYPECETCDNLDYTNDLPTTTTDPELTLLKVATGLGVTDEYLNTECGVEIFDPSSARIFLSIPSGTACTTVSPNFTGITMSNITGNPGRYIIKFNDTEEYGSLNVYEYDISGTTGYYYDDTTRLSYTGQTLPTGNNIGYEIFDSQSPLTGAQNTSGINSELEGGCQQYVTVYKESIVYGTYCVGNASTPYSGLTSTNITAGTVCGSGKIAVGQVIRGIDSNPCGTCGTHSGYSEFRYGLFTIIPAAAIANWGDNFDAITEYARRKLVAKVFCGGIANYKFIDNWLTGSLYMFPFKAKVRWDDEATLDLNVRRTKYCPDLVYFKAGTVENPDKRFYYRSTYFNGTTFSRSDREGLGHPTTIVDLGPRDEFIKEICTDPSLDPNCSVVRNIGPTSYQNFKEMLGLYINYKLDYLATDQNTSGNYNSFFENNGYGGFGTVMNGDILQLISINNEVGIEEFDLQNRNYAAYNPQVLDVESYPGLLNGGPLPINLVLDDGEGYRVRACLNEPGRLTESSQEVPFYLWEKGGVGFGTSVNQHWDYDNIEVQPLQGMTKNYKYTGDSTHKYLLLPMTKQYSGDTFTYTGVTYNDVYADIETTGTTHTTYNNQEEGFTVLEIATGTLDNPLTGTLWIRTGETGNWASKPWTNDLDFMIKPTSTNYDGTKQILSTPFLFYFGLRPGKTAIDKLIEKYGPKGAFPSAE
jgi:hypothetical protein